MTSISDRPIKYTDYIPLGNAIAEAFETVRAEWLELRDRGQAPSPLADYVKVKGPQALPAGVADALSRAPVYIRDRARTRAQALIVSASRDRAENSALPADQRYTLVLNHPEARRHVHRITGDPGPGRNDQRRKLTPAEVRFIRREHRPGRGSPTSTYAMARLFGVSKGVIYQVVQRRTYRDVPDEIPAAED